MQALLSRCPGGPETLLLEDVPDPQMGSGQILISIAACGVNFPDLLLIQDLYQAKPPRPFAPGAEVAGVVTDVGRDVQGFKVGDRVIGRCGWGGMAEKIALEPERCTHIPKSMPFEHAAAFLFTHATSYYALVTRAQLRPGETVLVLGAAGGVGIAAVQIAKALGARVIAAVSSEDKLAFARAHGADDGLIYSSAMDTSDARDFSRSLKTIVGSNGANVVFDPVGGPISEPALRVTVEGGRYLVLGFTAGIPRVPLNLPLLKSCDILGVNWRTLVLSHPEINEANQQELFRLYNRGLIAPIVTETFPLELAADAISKLQNRGAMGKMVIKVALL
ncbi:NADPH:quinone oxidoreductase family protein [Bradyrhizobium sp. G127]|jgi:NADPH2:quinone reductase|uniref:NADPH:quinone oxidoreductase family protein n=1 Tax=Bradyrhizobium sp. G127 TaxID=2904800 RepID=UPI001F347002|nr:NADPH:quinone oxidoreductase family protein [Bradyrhizobium sp. G127]MCF2522469.1 NADPH:quinone oxidoreductase family protein [Bradyrhizobium sp. G127]